MFNETFSIAKFRNESIGTILKIQLMDVLVYKTSVYFQEIDTML